MKTSEEFLNSVYSKAKIEKVKIKKRRAIITSCTSVLCALVIFVGVGSRPVGLESVSDAEYYVEEDMVENDFIPDYDVEKYDGIVSSTGYPTDITVSLEEITNGCGLATVYTDDYEKEQLMCWAQEKCIAQFTIAEWEKNQLDLPDHYVIVTVELNGANEGYGFSESCVLYLGDIEPEF